MRILGIDYGTKRVGVSIGDTETKVAVPLTVVEVTGVRGQVLEVVRIIKSEGIGLVVMGQGGKGRIEKKVQEFAEQLRKFVSVEIADEHFTTAQIEKIMKGYGKERRQIDKDSAAAALILQSWLELHTK